MKSNFRVYQSYLLRLWKEGFDPNPVWRASLQNVASGECNNFASLDELFQFLQQQSETSIAEMRTFSENHEIGYP